MADLRSEAAAERMEGLLNQHRSAIVESRVSSKGLAPAILEPIATERQNVAAPEKVAGLRFAIMLPYLIIILTMAGAMHPAMDLTAGEKERGTLETILACAVGRTELVLGKFLLVLTTSITTTMTSLASYALSLILARNLAKDYIQEATRGYQYSVSLQTVGAIFLLALPLAVFFSGLLVAVSLFAKNYKEAQTYGGYLILLAILPALVGMLPGIELTPKLAMIPVVNISLVAREIFTGSFPAMFYGVTFASTCVLAAIALYAAINLFRREDVLFRT
jgi:sodium transport system permease protein